MLINVLAAGTNVRYADAVANRASVAAANVYDAAEVRRARRILAGAKVRGYSDGFHALIHPDVMESLTADGTVEKIAQYGAGGVSNDFGLAAAWAYARTIRLADGPDEVHIEAIARMELR